MIEKLGVNRTLVFRIEFSEDMQTVTVTPPGREKIVWEGKFEKRVEEPATK